MLPRINLHPPSLKSAEIKGGWRKKKRPLGVCPHTGRKTRGGCLRRNNKPAVLGCRKCSLKNEFCSLAKFPTTQTFCCCLSPAPTISLLQKRGREGRSQFITAATGGVYVREGLFSVTKEGSTSLLFPSCLFLPSLPLSCPRGK